MFKIIIPKRTPEPFSFEYYELGKELQILGGTQRYVKKDEPLNLNKIYALIREEIV